LLFQDVNNNANKSYSQAILFSNQNPLLALVGQG